MKQVLIWSQEYASLEGSSAGEWLSQVMEKITLTEKVLIWTPPEHSFFGLQILSFTI